MPYRPVADPEFPVGGYQPCLWGEGGVPMSDKGTFWQKLMQKQKNCWIRGGGGEREDLNIVQYYRYFMQARPGLKGVIGLNWHKKLVHLIRLWSYKCDKGLRRSGKTFVKTREMSDFIF